MSQEPVEQRCPFCNGTGYLPVAWVAEHRAQERDYILIKSAMFNVWVELCAVFSQAERKTMTLDRLQDRIQQLRRTLQLLIRSEWR